MLKQLSVVIACTPFCVLADEIASRADLEALLDGNGTLEDFETLDVPFGGQRSDVGPLDSTTIFDGSGPGLVQPGASYNALMLYWNGDDYFALDSQTLGDSTGWRDFEIAIDYTVPVTAMGLDMQGYEGFGLAGTVSVFDAGLNLVSVTSVEGGFFGWEHASGIGRVIVDTQISNFYIMIDDHLYGEAGAGCIADCDGNGILNILDFVCFQTEWSNQTDLGDCDGNGEYNILDFVCFQAEFVKGCP